LIDWKFENFNFQLERADIGRAMITKMFDRISNMLSDIRMLSFGEKKTKKQLSFVLTNINHLTPFFERNFEEIIFVLGGDREKANQIFDYYQKVTWILYQAALECRGCERLARVSVDGVFTRPDPDCKRGSEGRHSH